MYTLKLHYSGISYIGRFLIIRITITENVAPNSSLNSYIIKRVLLRPFFPNISKAMFFLVLSCLENITLDRMSFFLNRIRMFVVTASENHWRKNYDVKGETQSKHLNIKNIKRRVAKQGRIPSYQVVFTFQVVVSHQRNEEKCLHAMYFHFH